MKNQGFSDLGSNPYFLKDTYANKNFSIIEGINYETQT